MTGHFVFYFKIFSTVSIFIVSSIEPYFRLIHLNLINFEVLHFGTLHGINIKLTRKKKHGARLLTSTIRRLRKRKLMTSFQILKKKKKRILMYSCLTVNEKKL